MSCGGTGLVAALSPAACSVFAAFRSLTSASSSAIRLSIDRRVAASTWSVSEDGWLCPSAALLNAGKRKRRITIASPEAWTVDLAKRTPHPHTPRCSQASIRVGRREQYPRNYVALKL